MAKKTTKKTKPKFLEILDDLEMEQRFFEEVLSQSGVNEELLESANSMIEYLEEAWQRQPKDIALYEKNRLVVLLEKSRRLRDHIALLVASLSGEIETKASHGQSIVGEA